MMIKKSLIVFSLIIAVGYGITKFLTRAIHMEWGHHFSFENELKLEIDSLEITVGDVKTIIQTGPDSLGVLEENIDVPEEGYPHKVAFKIFSNGKVVTLKADSFNCYNCDGNHEYTLKDSVAEYKFLN